MTSTQADIHLQQVARLVEKAEAADAESAASLYRRAANLLEGITHERSLQSSEGSHRGS